MKTFDDRNDGVRETGIALLGLIQQIEICYARSASSSGMHATDFRAVCVLSDAGKPMSPKDLSGFLGLTSGAVSALLTRLENGGFIARVPNPSDRRGVLVTLNEAAVAEPLRLYRILHEHHTEATKGLSNSELEAIRQYLRKIQDATAQFCGAEIASVPASGTPPADELKLQSGSGD
ncbi:UNVERIFIED_ORG: DNA-binding MarR family transcriptional regulator [Martelella mediterranea]